MTWTAEQVKLAVERDVERLIAPWMTGRGPNYVIDVATRNIIATGYWLNEQLVDVCNELDRRTQGWKFNRLSRTYDVFEVAAEVMNEALEGNVEQNRRPHRRWG